MSRAALWMSVLVAVLAGLVMSCVYVLLAVPRYRADILVQVEDKTPGAGGTLDDLSLMMGGKTPAETEIEIIRSRYLVGVGDLTGCHFDQTSVAKQLRTRGSQLIRL